MNFDINKSLEELEGTRWGNSDFQSSLTLKCQELRKRKLKNFSTDDLRVMIGQEIGLKYLVPIALEALAQNPFVAGDFYNGDLLEQVLKVDNNFWNQDKDLLYELYEIITSVRATIETISPLIKDCEL